MLKVFLEFESDTASVRLTKSQVLLAAFFAGKSMEAERVAVLGAILRASAAHIETARAAMLATEDPVFWEVTDRQKNLDHVAPERRAAVEKILAEAAALKRDGGAAI
jgi:hypothetical protein